MIITDRPYPVNIHVDTHEGDSNIDQELKLLNMPIYIRKMETGDVVLEAEGYTIGIEIKRKHDFQSSLYSGRLHDQVGRLYDQYDFPVLIIQGFDVWGEQDEGASIKAINTLNLRLSTFTTEGQLETVELIGEFVRLLTEHKFNVLRRPIILEEEVPHYIKVLCGFPFVSKQMAYDIMDKYGTLVNAIKHVDEWDEIKRLTEKRVSSIKDTLTTQYKGDDTHEIK